LLANANRDATQELREAEAKGSRLLEQARHQATELTNATRAEVEQTLEWARAQAAAILSRAQSGTEQLLAAAGLGEEATGRVAETIVDAARAAAESSRGGPSPEQGAGLRGPAPVPDEPRDTTADEASRDEGDPAPPLSPPVSPGPSPPSPPEERETGPGTEGNRTDES
jgi:hypothetical protein